MKTWYLTSPQGTRHAAHNLCHFVRNNPHLFAPEDVLWKRRKSKKGLGSAYCKATAGLSNVRQGRARSWKGWSLTDGKPPLRRINWGAVDWSKSTSQISNRLGIAGVAVSIARRKHAPHTIRFHRTAIPSETWRQVDWSMRTTDIANSLGCSISSVSAARRRHAPAI